MKKEDLISKLDNLKNEDKVLIGNKLTGELWEGYPEDLSFILRENYIPYVTGYALGDEEIKIMLLEEDKNVIS